MKEFIKRNKENVIVFLCSVVLILWAFVYAFLIINWPVKNPALPREFIVVGKMTVGGGKNSRDHLILILKEATGYEFDIGVSPTTYFHAMTNEKITLTIKDPKIPDDNTMGFHLKILLFILSPLAMGVVFVTYTAYEIIVDERKRKEIYK